MRFQDTIISDSLALFYYGLSLGEICRHIVATKGVFVHPTSVWRWIIRYSRDAFGILSNIKIDSRRWVIDETMEETAGQDIWIFDVIDCQSKFLITTYTSLTKNIRFITEVLSEAQSRTVHVPEQITSRKMKVYLSAIEDVFGADGKHIVLKNLSADSALVDEFRGATKERRMIMRKLKKLESVRIILNGFIVHYNYLRPHPLLDLQTPAYKAGLTMPFMTWNDMLRNIA
jgi:transposase-like protein